MYAASSYEAKITHYGMQQGYSYQKDGVVRYMAMYVGHIARRYFAHISQSQRDILFRFLDEREITLIDRFIAETNEEEKRFGTLQDKLNYRSDKFNEKISQNYTITKEKLGYLLAYIDNSPNYIVLADALCIGESGKVKYVHYMKVEETDKKVMAALSTKMTILKQETSSTTKWVQAVSEMCWDHLNRTYQSLGSQSLSPSTYLLESQKQSSCCCIIL